MGAGAGLEPGVAGLGFVGVEAGAGEGAELDVGVGEAVGSVGAGEAVGEGFGLGLEG